MKKRSFVFLFRFFFFVSSRAALFVVFLPSSAIKEDEETQIGELSRNKKKQSIKNSLARAALDVAVPYAAQRKQFNTRIGDFQLVAAKLADGWTRTQAARALVYSAAAKADAKKKGGESSSSSSPSSNNSPTYLSVSGGWSSKGERARECAAAILFSAETATHEVELEARCAGRGTPLRAPTESRGLAVLCRDSFAGELTIRLYEKTGKKGGKGGKGKGKGDRKLVVELESKRAAVETGGGPWGETWAAAAAMRQPFRSLVKAPVDPGRIAALLPERWRPRGL